MKIGIIADDLTGANDTGVQFAKKGMKTSVLMGKDRSISKNIDVLIIDTDSRSINENDAYSRVEEAISYLQSNDVTLLYKKIDSTMRGNIGVELDAIYNKVKPEFMIIAPAYPETNRKVIKGHLFVNQNLIHNTGFSNDPKNPVQISFVPEMIEKGSNQKVGLITKEDMIEGFEHVYEKMLNYKKECINYIVFDTETNEDLNFIANLMQRIDDFVVSVGSAGLAEYLIQEKMKKQGNEILKIKKDLVMFIVGSVNDITRKQLDKLLAHPNVSGVEFYSEEAVKGQYLLNKEISRVSKEINKAVQKKMHVVLYSAGDKTSINHAIKSGEVNGLTKEMVSEQISQTLGLIATLEIERHGFSRLFITGGETAKRICERVGVSEFRLIDEVEKGVPYGVFIKEEIIAITKAGGFGTEDVMVKSLELLEGVDETCVL